ncbi:MULTISPECIES: tRNA1(Val) (adenine(37)-N6)-methyltransferase [Anaerococcus]|uniref:Methyltransferase n=1 Tax=Anaerococcus nagyae TaxID=1755241 RepID=A0A3E2TK13_9FIRM|nr:MULTISPECIES: methyltransferase [Anaerococcus]MBP2069452.1 tRNA1Val (adenine37-N6)-methyltransferase [Anaerococcus nagyae]MDU2565775.1 methyltransferase [Anaerococcus sp.]RGB77322.1 methyltransferase [Anaerococcus nagyae]
MDKLDYIPKTNIKMIHKNKSYSFGIDSILLLDFAKMKRDKKLVDIGSGSGILSLGASAYYNPQKIYAIEIQKEKADLLIKNLDLNKIKNIEVINEDLNTVNLGVNNIDYIITNPPYYKINDNIGNKSEEFLISRQEKYLTLENIFNFANKTLKDKGKLFMIHKPERMIDILSKSNNLKPKRIRFASSTFDKKPQFILIEFVKNAKDGLKIEDPLIIYENGSYSHEVKKINGIIN